MRFLLLLIFVLLSASVQADWVIDPDRSHLAVVSIKSGDIAEVHHFNTLSGEINAAGAVEIRLPLDAIETAIPIRNERMRELLFVTAEYPEARLTATLDTASLAAMHVGHIGTLKGEALLTLHGVRQRLPLHMQAVRVDPNTIMVASQVPVMIDAAEFGLSAGIEQLRKLAGLESISHAVPVTFVLTFVAL